MSASSAIEHSTSLEVAAWLFSSAVMFAFSFLFRSLGLFAIRWIPSATVQRA